MPEAGIIIVGGGPAGLTTAGALKKVGVESVILDRGERIGQSWEERYDRLHLHTVKAFSGLAHYPIPRAYPNYLSKNQYAHYLREYATHFHLNFISNTLVKRVRPEGSGWRIETDQQTWTGRAVVIATGPFGHPRIPELPGLPGFCGQTLHSSGYRSGSAFRGKRVLVIGAGNSGMEIAVDLMEQGAGRVALSVRSAPPVVPRDFLGVPAQVFGIVMNSLPPAVGDRVGQTFARIAFGDLSRQGFPKAAWLPFSARRTPVIDVGFVQAFKASKIAVRPGVQEFAQHEVVFDGGLREEFDAVILATGFCSGLETLLEPQGLLDDAGSPRFASGEPTAYPNLYFMGFFDSLRGFLYESNLASRRLAQRLEAII